MAAFPVAAAIVSALFALLMLQQFLARKTTSQLAWGLSLLMFSGASVAAARGIAVGWTEFSYRSFYLLGAIVNVPVLALGTVYLFAPRKIGHFAALVVAAGCLYAAGAVFSADVNRAAIKVASGIPDAGKAMPDAVRFISRSFSFAGFFVVLAGALWSAWRLSRKKLENPETAEKMRRLAAGNVLIATGTFVVALASIFARQGKGEIFSIGLLLGVTTMFSGFLKTRRQPESVTRPQASPDAPE